MNKNVANFHKSVITEPYTRSGVGVKIDGAISLKIWDPNSWVMGNSVN